jgi:hypothetical protein
MGVKLRVPRSLLKEPQGKEISLERELGGKKTRIPYILPPGKRLMTDYDFIDFSLIVGRIICSPWDIEK